jgi:hypothetical protein
MYYSPRVTADFAVKRWRVLLARNVDLVDLVPFQNITNIVDRFFAFAISGGDDGIFVDLRI